MKAKRLNLCQVVRDSLISAGYSSVLVVNAVNSELAKAVLTNGDKDEEGNRMGEAKTGDSKIKKDGKEYHVTVTGTFKYLHRNTIPCHFDVWHSAIAKAEKVATFDSVSIPKIFIEWLDKFAKAQEPVNTVSELATK